MKTVRLGKTGLQVSRIGFGGIPIQRLVEPEAIRLVRRSLELGMTFFDTANGYSTSEERIGKALAGRRDQAIIATKTPARDLYEPCGAGNGGLTRNGIRVDGSQPRSYSSPGSR